MHPVEGLPALDLLTALPGNPCLIQRPEGGRPFERVSDFQPAGDQPQTIAELVEGLRRQGPPSPPARRWRSVCAD